MTDGNAERRPDGDRDGEKFSQQSEPKPKGNRFSLVTRLIDEAVDLVIRGAL